MMPGRHDVSLVESLPTIVHFDLAADDVSRAKTFYSELFGWKFEKIPGPVEYFLIETFTLDGGSGIGGGMGQRGSPDQHITNYFGVPSVNEFLEKVKNLGGTVIQPRMTVPGWGYLAVCQDTEGNLFGLWEIDETAQ